MGSIPLYLYGVLYFEGLECLTLVEDSRKINFPSFFLSVYRLVN